jgi:type IV pilus assembly protein PilF
LARRARALVGVNFQFNFIETGNTMKIKAWVKIGLVITLTSVVSCGAQQPANRDAQMASATREIGEAYMLQGDITSALRELHNAEKLNPNDPFIHNNLGLCYMARNRLSDAVAYFQRAVALKPGYAPARNNLGVAYLQMEEYDAAIAIFNELSKDILYATPQNPLSNLGFAYYKKGDFSTSLNYYREALKYQPEFVTALLGAGRTHVAMNQGRPALPYLEQAVRLSPKTPDIHFWLAEAYLLTAQNPQARAAYEAVIQLAPKESELTVKAKQRLGIR